MHDIHDVLEYPPRTKRKRRRSDNCIAVRLWDKYTPYIQIGGFFLAFATGTFAAGGIWKDVSAYGGRIESLEVWKNQEASDMTEIKQSLKDIHEYLLPGRR